MKEGKAVYIGRQDTADGLPAVALFNVEWAGNELDGSTVSVKTVNRLGLTRLEDKAGKRLQGVPSPVCERVANIQKEARP